MSTNYRLRPSPPRHLSYLCVIASKTDQELTESRGNREVKTVSSAEDEEEEVRGNEGRMSLSGGKREPPLMMDTSSQSMSRRNEKERGMKGSIK